MHSLVMEDEYIRLEPLAMSHVNFLSQWVHDTDTWRWWLREPPLTEQKLSAAIASALQVGEERQPFAIYSKETKDFVGETSFWFRDAGDIEIGSTWLCHAVRGTGFNRKVKRLMIDHAINVLGFSRVVLQTDALNLRCQRAIEKIGGVEFDRIVDHKAVWDGRMRTSVFYAVDRVLD